MSEQANHTASAEDTAPPEAERATTGEVILAIVTVAIGVGLILIAIDSVTNGAVFGFAKDRAE